MEWVVIVVIVYIPLMFGVYHLAERYGREAGSWTLVSLFISPIVCIILLLCIGETKAKWEERIVEEELLRSRVKYELEKE